MPHRYPVYFNEGNPLKIIIIGASSGMGRALAQLYLSQGHVVGISARRVEALHTLAAEHPASQVVVQPFDVSHPGAPGQVDAMIEALGGLDLFVYCAGGGDSNEALDPDFEWEMFQANAAGFMALASHVFNFFMRQGYGHMAAISSLAGNRGMQAAPAYSASKAYVSNYLEALWVRSRKRKLNIAVTDIQPGFVLTHAPLAKMPWVVPVDKATRQIARGLAAKRKKVYISRRWGPVAWIMRHAPSWMLVKLT